MSFKRQDPSLNTRHMLGIVIVFLVVLITVILALLGAEMLRIGWRAGGTRLLWAFFFEETIIDWYQVLASGVIVAALASALTARAIYHYQKLKSSASEKRKAARSLTRPICRSGKGCEELRRLPKPLAGSGKRAERDS